MLNQIEEGQLCLELARDYTGLAAKVISGFARAAGAGGGYHPAALLDWVDRYQGDPLRLTDAEVMFVAVRESWDAAVARSGNSLPLPGSMEFRWSGCDSGCGTSQGGWSLRWTSTAGTIVQLSCRRFLHLELHICGEPERVCRRAEAAFGVNAPCWVDWTSIPGGSGSIRSGTNYTATASAATSAASVNPA
jgi:hypothetical protein